MTTVVEELRIEGVSKSYGSTAVLSALTATFRGGRIGALVGPNGAGKTTLLRIAAGLQRAESGTVRSQRPILYYGGFDTLPVRGTENVLRKALGLPHRTGGEQKLKTLSRGQLHSVGLRAAIDLRPPVLLLDEPWTALEPDAREELNQTLTRLAGAGHLVLCSTHDLDEVARIVDDILFLKKSAAPVWRAREEQDSARFDRDELLRLYRGEEHR
ncbi:MAG TPA: ATP-binding cassette domain-containing protein [Thermoanaerobaculia bacterium]|jgi:ABC-2 type transport system ATP-binding protein